MKDFPRSTYRIDVKQQYRNMKQVIDRHPEIVDYAVEAIRRTGLTAGEILDPRRHRRLAAVLHGPALPQHLRRRARLPFAARVGEPAGYGEGGRDHRASRDDLGRAGEADRAAAHGEASRPALAVTSQIAPGSSTDWPLANGASVSRIDGTAAAINSGGWPSSARLAGPISSAPCTAASSPLPAATSKVSGQASIATSVKPASPGCASPALRRQTRTVRDLPAQAAAAWASACRPPSAASSSSCSRAARASKRRPACPLAAAPGANSGTTARGRQKTSHRSAKPGDRSLPDRRDRR